MKISKILSEKALENLAQGYDVSKIEKAWNAGDFGWLCVYASASTVRPASREEAIQSFESGIEGAFIVDCRHDDALKEYADGEDAVTCYVQP